MNKQRIDQYIDENTAAFVEISDKIWEYAEMRFQEYQSAALLADFLEREGFQVERAVAGIPTAFAASFGTQGPVIGILGEFDALAGMNQTGGIAKKESPVPEASGHGCGHNLLGAGALAAAVAVKRLIEETGLAGTVRYYGCPGEEGGSGKTFMARDGIFTDIDAALTWHPFGYNAIMSVNTLANFQVYYRFRGRSAHAAAAPHLGRSALDAVELMNVGVNYLREHIIPEARVHYAITNTGGNSPNVVQAEAEVLYLIRAPQLGQVQEIYERICNIAQGAALMTGTECEIVFDKACSNCIPNETLERLLFANFQEVGAPEFDAADKRFSREIRSTLPATAIDSDLAMARGFMGGKGQEILKELKEKEVADIILPYVHSSTLLAGSTDVGDVSWIVPTAQVAVACQAFGTPGHSWQTVSQGVTGIAHKGMIVAAKVLARTAVDVLANPAIIKQAKAELREKLGDAKYICPIPAGIQPKPFSK
jgi:aminobenzoyl-glutamate utilization protein B